MEDFAALYARYFRGVYRFALSLCRDTGLAEEITQETFHRALKGLTGFRGQSSVETWLLRIAKNQYYDHVRRRKDVSADDVLMDLASRNDLEGELLQKEQLMRVHRLLHGMDEPYREVFSLRVFGELSHAQVASLFGKSEAWARTTFYRAKVQLQERMREEE